MASVLNYTPDRVNNQSVMLSGKQEDQGHQILSLIINILSTEISDSTVSSYFMKIIKHYINLFLKYPTSGSGKQI